MQTTIAVSAGAQKVINEFQELHFYEKKVLCPYFMNIRKQRGGLRVLVGKGDPGEIVREVIVWAKVKHFDLQKANPDQIRIFMINQNIGIDCSGFITHVINYWLHEQGDKPLIKSLVFKNNDPISRLKRLLRPVENIGANLITAEDNCEKIEQVKDIAPGDLIRLKGRLKNSHHVMLVFSVTKENELVKEFQLVESTKDYGKGNGIRFSKVIITDQNLGLKEQTWTDIDPETQRNWTYENLLKEYEDNGIRRLKRVKLK
ncbi:MAG: hypothetical protein WCJ58_02015 [bacterium]